MSDKLTLHRMWHAGASVQEISQALGVSTVTVNRRARDAKLPPRKRRPPTQINDPTLEQIAERAAAIRAKNLAAMRDV